MKVTVVTGPWLPVPAIEGGSAHRMWEELGPELVKLGAEVTILSKAHPAQPKQEQLSGVKYIRHSGFSQGKSQILNLGKDLLYALQILPTLPNADVLVINDFWLPILLRIMGQRSGKRIVIVGRTPKGQHKLHSNKSSFVVHSESDRNLFRKMYPSLEPSLYKIPPSISKTFFEPTANHRWWTSSQRWCGGQSFFHWFQEEASHGPILGSMEVSLV